MDKTKSRFETVTLIMESEMVMPYCYGKSDCFFLALAVIDALRGCVLQKEYAGIYTTFNGAQRAMKKRGFVSMGDLFARHLEPIAPAMAKFGDVVVLEISGPNNQMMEHSAICVGGQFITRTLGGLSSHGLGAVKSAFRV